MTAAPTGTSEPGRSKAPFFSAYATLWVILALLGTYVFGIDIMWSAPIAGLLYGLSAAWLAGVMRR